MGGPHKAEYSRGGRGVLSLVGCFMRDLLAVAGVVVLAVCLGVTAAYLSVDLTPPGLDLIRPPKPAIAAQLKLEEHQSSIQAEASECKYCVAVADLAQRFARHAKSARQQADALRETISLEHKEIARQDELLKAERSADGAEAAAAALTSWASRCKSEDFCRAPAKRVAAAACNPSSSSSVASAFQLAAAVKRAANGCAAASCPSIDCQSSAALRSDVQYVERALFSAGGRFSTQSSGRSASQLPVGASTLSSEIKRVSDEAIYISKMLPLMLENATANAGAGQLPKLASGMVDERAISAAQLASVMEHAAEIAGNPKTDLRSEAAWRLKSLAANLAQLGKETEMQEGGSINWRVATDALGAALVDVARLEAMVARASDANAKGAGCDPSAPAAAQQLREAAAMLDLCRMRSACASRTINTAAPSKSFLQAIARGQGAAERLIVQEVGSPELVQVAEGEVAQPIQLVRAQYGVCTKAAELREASAIAPAAAQAVAQGMTPSVQPAAGPVAPQDLVTGAVNSAIQVSAPGASEESSVIEVAAPPVESTGMDDAMPAAAPAAGAAPAPVATPAFSGNLLSPSTPSFVGADGRPLNSAPAGN